MSDSVSMQLMEQTQTAIRALALTGVASANVLIQKVPSILKKDLQATTPVPCIIIAPAPEGLNPNAGTNVRDDVDYNFQVLMVQKSAHDQSANLDRLLLWRESIRRKLMNSRFTVASAITSILRGVVLPGPVFDSDSFSEGFDVSGLRLQVTSRETRIT